MARYRKWDLRAWSDQKFRELTPLPPSGQSLWLYLILGPQTSNIPGLFEASEVDMADRLTWSLEDFRKAFAEASTKGMAKADWKARLVWLPNAPKYNPPESPNVVVSWATTFDELPECPLRSQALQALKVFVEGLHPGYLEAFRKAFAKAMPIQEQEQEQEQDKKHVDSGSTGSNGSGGHKPDPVVLVFQHWQTVHKHPASKLDPKRRKLILARLKDGYTVEQLCKAIDGFKNSPYHMGDNDNHTKYDSIELFLRDGKHIDMGVRYADQPEALPEKPKPVFR